MYNEQQVLSQIRKPDNNLASTSITPELTTVDQHMDQRAGPWPT
ncbi:hypothetical protein MCC10087_0039 [Bifidobacterium longum subsp. longum]|nr:hypothetical protein MCC10087_0039 [Bifidobacterium longum subsp. longum]